MRSQINLDRVRELGLSKDFESDFVTYNIEYDLVTFKDAMTSSKAKQWKESVKVRWTTWVLVEENTGCKWIFKKKLKPDGSVDKYKVRLVAKGFKQNWEWTISIPILRVLRYLKGTTSLVIHYGRFPAVLKGYSDASWIAKNSGSNRYSGYVFTLGRGIVSGKFAKQIFIF
ncbi:UNVERIFIED_CONTAM: hypothetical protein Scaly_1190000 [Sesamum calycinum]|uniref:Uncharacterized protein n=1 Tax=Sesamum calycinum TaxID=2727403 RepID=A0AAW2Q3Z0_9LAMI